MNLKNADASLDTAQTKIIQTALADKNWPVALRELFAVTQTVVKSKANQAGTFAEDIDQLCQVFADSLSQDMPVKADKIGFDRITNIHVVTEIYQAGGHRSLIDQIIAAYPDERHIVLFSGAFEKTRDFSMASIVASGGFPIYPDSTLDRFDRLLWLREKLGTFTARRLFLHHHPSDVIATIALAEFAPKYANRAYVMHHADTVASLGVDFPQATHLAIRPEQKQTILASRPDYSVHVVPLVFDPERQAPPINPKIVAKIKTGKRTYLSEGALITATCGGGHKFCGDGDLGLHIILRRILQTTGGRHYHIGSMNRHMKATIQTELDLAGIHPDRLILLPQTKSVASTLIQNNVDIFLASFPVGGGLTIVEAAYAGLPIALYGGAVDDAGRYVSGLTHCPNDVLIWKTPEDLEQILRSFWLEPSWYGNGVRQFKAIARSPRKWLKKSSKLVELRLQLHEIVAVIKGRNRTLIKKHLKQCAKTLIKTMVRSPHKWREKPDKHAKIEPQLRTTVVLTEDRDSTSIEKHRKRNGKALIRAIARSPRKWLEQRDKLTKFRSRLHAMSRSSRKWFEERGRFAKFQSRLHAIVAISEGRDRTPIEKHRNRIAETLINPDDYLAKHSDVAKAKVDPIQHFLSYGEKELRWCHPVFDARFYLSQLTGITLQIARTAPLTHYILRGEAMGYRPHPLFDPEFCKTGMAVAGQLADPTGDPLADSILVQYLNTGSQVAPHMFFDTKHYGRQADLVPSGQSLLTHFIETGAHDPHPLINMDRLKSGKKPPYDVFISHLTQDLPHKKEPTTTLLFTLADIPNDAVARYENAAPNLLWGYLIEGNKTGRNPHMLIDIAHIERMRPGTLVSATAVIRPLAINRLGVDTHPLVQGQYIVKQAPFADTLPISLTQYFIESGKAHNIDPHPLFSMQYHLYHYADLRKISYSPLVHYLKYGQFEGRSVHPAFDGTDYYKTRLKGKNGEGSPILSYVSHGMMRFWPSLAVKEDLMQVTQKTAISLFEAGHDQGASNMLITAIHPETAHPHPTLVTQVRTFCDTTEDAEATTQIYPPTHVHLDRPSVVSTVHITPPIGDYVAPAATASVYTDATLIPGNDGFIANTGRWIDFGLSGFDPEKMRVKENGAVVAVANGKVLLRHYTSDMSLPAGILASGTYSHNYFHFLLEVLPRILLAADIAPVQTPVLADDVMPKQHYQILRHYLPNNPVIRLTRHNTVQIGRLYVGSMPNTIQDAFGDDMPPADAVRFHPQMIQRIARQGGVAAAPESDRRLWLQRISNVRSLLNADEIQTGLLEMGFDPVNCATLSFSEQAILFSQASGGIVGQSGAHMANMIFAPRGTRVLALFSNAPGTNFYFLAALGAILGHEIINVAGWRIFGTTKGKMPAAHEHFTVPVSLVTPFFHATRALVVHNDPVAQARSQLDILHKSVANADALTGAWGVRSTPTPAGFEDTMITARRAICGLFDVLTDDDFSGLLTHPFFIDFAGNTRSGYHAIRDYNVKEGQLLRDIKAYFETASSAARMQNDTQAARMLAAAMLYLPAWQLPLITALDQLESDLRPHYLRWLSTPPYLYRKGDDAGYVQFTELMLRWLSRHLDLAVDMIVRKQAMAIVGQLDLGLLLLVDAPVRATLEARNDVLDKVALRGGPTARIHPRPHDLSQGRIRIGILCRTFAKGPDSEAVVAFFNTFDQSQYEIFAYSVGFKDRVVVDDEDFSRIFAAKIDHRRVLHSNPYDCRETLLADDLDVFLYANATTFGIRELERALYHRVAPVQMVLNSHLPVSLGFPSFDYYLTGRSDSVQGEMSQTDYPEQLLHVDGSVINYLNSFEPRPDPAFDRAALGLSDSDIVMMNGGSSQKLRYDCLKTMLRAVHAVPNGKLLLAPYNPGWAARSQAFAFNHQLAKAVAEVGVSTDKIIVLGELSVAEAEAALALSDIYLSSFPHGGATMTHLALIYGTPPVVLRRQSTKSIDQFLVGSLGFHQMLASTPNDYVTLVTQLAANPAQLEELSVQIRTAAKNPVFVSNPEFSQAMQSAIQGAVEKARTL